MWKEKIENVGAVTRGQSKACRDDVPGPVKDSILQYPKKGLTP